MNDGNYNQDGEQWVDHEENPKPTTTTTTTSSPSPSPSPPSSKTFSEVWTQTLLQIRKPITNVLVYLATSSARHPKTVIVSSIVVSLLTLGVGLFTGFHVITDGDFLWTPTPSRVLSHGTYLQNDSGFPIPPRATLVTLHADGSNILSQAQEGTTRLFTLLDTIRQTDGYEEVCQDATVFMMTTDEDGSGSGSGSSSNKTCLIDSATRFWNYNVEAFLSSVSSDQDVIDVLSASNYPDQTPVDDVVILGNSQREEENGTLTYSQMFINYVYLPPDGVLGLEEKILDNVLRLRQEWEEEEGNMFRVEIFAQRSFDDEFERAIVNDIPFVPFIFIVMSIFTGLVFFKRDWVESRTTLGTGAVFTVLLSIISGYGLLFIIGVPFTSMTQILPFIMFGIGLDDAFILWGAYQRTDASKDTEERIEDTIEDVGVSIFVTTITSIVAFSLGTISTIPAVYWLCYYAAPTIAIDFILQITFFIALIVMDERRVKDRRRDFLICLSAPDSEDDDNASEVPKQEPKGSIFDRFMLWFSDVLMKPFVKVVVIISFLGLCGGLGYSATMLKQEFKFTDVLPNPSYVGDFWSRFTDYTIGSGVAPYVVFRDVDQSLPSVQEQMEQYVNELVGIDAIMSQPSFFWLRDFEQFVSSSSDASLTNASFVEQLDMFLEVPSFNQLYSRNIVRDEDGKIVISRTRVRMDNVDQENVRNQVEALADVLDVSESQSINEDRKDWAFFTFDNLYYVWYFYTVTPSELLQSTIVGVGAVAVITILFVPHWTSVLFVTPIMIMLYVDLLGFLQVCGIAINAVSYISLVMSIGLMVDFLLHILLRYYESKETSREAKVKDVVRTMGTSVLIGGISSLLGVIPLAMSTSDIFSTIFYTFLGLVVFGITHGLIFLPVILSLFGPNIVLDL